MMNPKRVLVLAPHTDDAELGCGGTLARFLAEGVHVHVAVFSTAEESLPKGARPGTLKDEFYAAMNTMGIPPDQYTVHDYPVRRLSYHRQEVLESLVNLRREVKPEAVLLPAGTDLHQDHQVVNIEGLRAFKDITVWGYELPWNHVEFSANAFVVLSEAHLQKKWAALQAYQTQLDLARPYFSWEFVRSLACIRGVQVKTAFAEAFEVIRIRM
jgi:LmbE family N-acetylglucosaminyl deacetylase